jgi:hypothetical protein
MTYGLKGTSLLLMQRQSWFQTGLHIALAMCLQTRLHTTAVQHNIGTKVAVACTGHILSTALAGAAAVQQGSNDEKHSKSGREAHQAALCSVSIPVGNRGGCVQEHLEPHFRNLLCRFPKVRAPLRLALGQVLVYQALPYVETPAR